MKLTLSRLLSGYLSREKINTNYEAIEAAIENTLSRDGQTPNEMGANLDMGGHKIINVQDPTDDLDGVNKQYVDDLVLDGIPAPTVTVGQVFTGAPGTSASVTNVGTANQAVFDFVIPRGDQGEPGQDADIQGDVFGPASSTNESIVLFDGLTGKLIKDSTTAITDLAPVSHTHAISDVTGLQTALDGKASTTHSHAISDVTGLQTALDGKAATSHTHVKADITDFAHTHVKADITDFTHTHPYSDLTSKPNSIDAIDDLTPAADRYIYFTGAASASLGTITNFARTVLDDADAATARTTLGAAATSHTHVAADITDQQNLKPTESLIIAVSDEITAITTGTGKTTFRMPYAFTLTAVRASLNTASTSGAVTVDINEGGASILSTKLTIDQDEKTSTTAATAAVISDTSLADDAEITIDIDGAGTGAKGLKVVLIGRRT